MKHKVRIVSGCILFILFLCLPGSIVKAQNIDIQRKRFLLLDGRLIEKTENAELVVETVQKYPGNPLFHKDKPWEKRFDNFYGNIIYDDEDSLYKCWYSPFIIDFSAKGMTLEQREKKYKAPLGREMAICYATSKDGILWEKPDLGLVDYEGSKNNNIIWRGPHGAGIFKDSREVDQKARYKIIYHSTTSGGLWYSFSLDGIHWQKPGKCEGVNVAGDTHNNAFWAPTLGKYVGITRTWGDLGREVARIESSDFINWTKAEVVLKGTEKDIQPYAMPVFFYGSVYLGLLAVFNQKIDKVSTELAWSPDTRVWHRISPGIPLIPCSEKKLDYDYGCVYACTSPVFLKNEIRLYYGGSDWLHSGWRNGFLCLATLRPDGFAGFIQKSKSRPAMILTAALKYQGGPIRITTDVGQGGSISVHVLDINGKIISSAEQVTRTVTDKQIILNKTIISDMIKLRFEIINSKLFSFSFDD